MAAPGWEIASVSDIFDWGDAAAWVQALGSIAAIWFAGRFGHRDRLRKSADQMQAVHGLAKSAAKLIRAGVEAFNQAVVGDFGPVKQFPVENFNDMDRLLLSIPVLDIGGLDAPEVVIALRNDVRLMRDYVAYQAGRADGPDAETFKAVLRLGDQADAIVKGIANWAVQSEMAARRWWR